MPDFSPTSRLVVSTSLKTDSSWALRVFLPAFTQQDCRNKALGVMTSLASLPSELVGQILGFSDSSHCTIELWKCGCHLLQLKIAQGVTFIDLQNLRSVAFRRVPTFLRKLRSLRGLRIDCGPHPLQMVAEFKRTLRLLSQRLESLELTFQNATQLFKSMQPIKSDSSDHPSETDKITTPKIRDDLLDFATHYPRLHTLKTSAYFKPSALSSLPNTITSLWVNVLNIKDESSAPTFSPELQSLTLGSFLEPTWAFKSTSQGNLKEICILNPIYDDSGIVSPLPPNYTDCLAKTLTNIKSHSLPLIPGLPPLLQSLSLHSASSSLDFTLLPKNLTSLVIPRFVHYFMLAPAVRLLPRTLTHLQTPLRLIGVREGDLPPSLVSLEAHFDNPTCFYADLLPPSLRSLSLSFDYEPTESDYISKLPPLLTLLDVPFGLITSDKFVPPPMLKTLRIRGKQPNYAGGYTLPKGLLSDHLEELDMWMYKFPRSSLPLLPRFLKVLCLNSIYEDKKYLSQVASNIITSEIGICSLLPRTLETLSLTVAPNEVPEAWRFAPHLKSLLIPKESVLDSDFLLHLPMKSMTNLEVAIGVIQDKHIIALGQYPLLPVFFNLSVSSVRLSFKGVTHWPPNLHIDKLCVDQVGLRRTEINKAIEANDHLAFQKLLDPSRREDTP